MGYVAAGVAIAIGAATAAYTSDQQRKQVHQQMDQAKKLAQRPGVQAAKAPVINRGLNDNLRNSAIAAGLGAGAKGTLGGTLLSGAGGVPSSSYNTAGGSTLLGG